jgi:hypothetical protein
MKIVRFIRNNIFPAKQGLVPAVFLHIQKTAGTTIVELASRHYRKNFVSHGQYLEQTMSELEKVAFVSGHFGFEFARPLLDSRFSFTFLRDPVDRLLSFYCFCREMDPSEYPIYRLAQELSLEQFLRAGLEDEQVRCYLWNQQVWQLAYGYGDPSGRLPSDFTENELLATAIEHMGQLSHVGFTETFEHDLGAILSALQFQSWEKGFVSNKTPNKLGKIMLSPLEMGLANELTRLDLELYRAAWDKQRPGSRLMLDRV